MLTPDDIQKKIFALGRKLENNDVGIFVKEMQINYQLIYDQVNEQTKQIAGMEKKLKYYRDVEGSLQDALIHAEKVSEVKINEAKRTATKIEEDAHKKAQDIIADAKSELTYLKSLISEFEKAYDGYQEKYKDFIEGQIKFIDDSKEFMKNEKIKVKKFVSNIDIEPSVSNKDVIDEKKEDNTNIEFHKEEVKEEPKFKMPQFDIPKPQVEEPKPQVKEPEVQVEEPKVQVAEPEVQVEEPKVQVAEPVVQVEEPKVQVEEPKETLVKEPEIINEQVSVKETNNDGVMDNRVTPNEILQKVDKLDSNIESNLSSDVNSTQSVEKQDVVEEVDDSIPDLTLTDYVSPSDNEEEIVLTNNYTTAEQEQESDDEKDKDDDSSKDDNTNENKDLSSDFDKFASHMSFDNFDTPEQTESTFSFAKMMAGNTSNNKEDTSNSIPNSGVAFNPSSSEAPVADTQNNFSETANVSTDTMSIPSIDTVNEGSKLSEQDDDLFSLPEINVDDLDFSNLNFNDDSTSSMDFNDIPSLDALGSGVDFNSINNQPSGVDFNSMNNQPSGVDFNSMNNQSSGVDFNSMNNQPQGLGLKKQNPMGDGKPRLPKSLDDTSTVVNTNDDDNGPSLSQNANIELTFANNSMFPKKKNNEKEKLLASLNISSNKDAEKVKIRQMESNYAKDLLSSNQQLAVDNPMNDADVQGTRGYGPDNYVSENNGFASKPLNQDAQNNRRPLF